MYPALSSNSALLLPYLSEICDSFSVGKMNLEINLKFLPDMISSIPADVLWQDGIPFDMA